MNPRAARPFDAEQLAIFLFGVVAFLMVRGSSDVEICHLLIEWHDLASVDGRSDHDWPGWGRVLQDCGTTAIVSWMCITSRLAMIEAIEWILDNQQEIDRLRALVNNEQRDWIHALD